MTPARQSPPLAPGGSSLQMAVKIAEIDTRVGLLVEAMTESRTALRALELHTEIKDPSFVPVQGAN